MTDLDNPTDPQWDERVGLTDAGTSAAHVAVMSRLEPDARSAVEEFAHRLLAGQKGYGLIQAITDPRDFVAMTEEELLDGVAYLAWRVAQLRRDPTRGVLEDVRLERQRQDAKWGEQNHELGTGGRTAECIAGNLREACNHVTANGRVTWAHILGEEVAEAFAESDEQVARNELIQAAAVCVAAVECIDRRQRSQRDTEPPKAAE